MCKLTRNKRLADKLEKAEKVLSPLLRSWNGNLSESSYKTSILSLKTQRKHSTHWCFDTKRAVFKCSSVLALGNFCSLVKVFCIQLHCCDLDESCSFQRSCVTEHRGFWTTLYFTFCVFLQYGKFASTSLSWVQTWSAEFPIPEMEDRW